MDIAILNFKHNLTHSLDESNSGHATFLDLGPCTDTRKDTGPGLLETGQSLNGLRSNIILRVATDNLPETRKKLFFLTGVHRCSPSTGTKFSIPPISIEILSIIEIHVRHSSVWALTLIAEPPLRLTGMMRQVYMRSSVVLQTRCKSVVLPALARPITRIRK